MTALPEAADDPEELRQTESCGEPDVSGER